MQRAPIRTHAQVAKTVKQQTLNEEFDEFEKVIGADLARAEAADEVATPLPTDSRTHVLSWLPTCLNLLSDLPTHPSTYSPMCLATYSHACRADE